MDPRCGMAIIPSWIHGWVKTMGIRKVIVVIDCANVFWEEKIQCPVKCYANLFV